MGTWMRSAVRKKKQFYIEQLVRFGLAADRDRLEEWTMAELRREYERFHPAQTIEGGRRHGQTSARTGQTHH
ncbi:Fur-regulated basic protein FbpA [Geobacillus thermoleovorans]|uniref:Fur-regulated basic protein FbpA n=1 Tax=Geobacillus thermoleovorans TaxID=33941 RepID=UPI003DA5A6F1